MNEQDPQDAHKPVATRKKEPLIDRICRPLADIIFQEKPLEPSKLEPRTPKPEKSKIILEVKEDEVLVVIPASEWETVWTVVAASIFLGAGILQLMYSIDPNRFRVLNGLLFLLRLSELPLLAAWYWGFHLERRLWLSRETVVKEWSVGKHYKGQLKPFRDLQSVEVQKVEDDGNTTYSARLLFRGGSAIEFCSGGSGNEVKWLVGELQHAPLLAGTHMHAFDPPPSSLSHPVNHYIAT